MWLLGVVYSAQEEELKCAVWETGPARRVCEAFPLPLLSGLVHLTDKIPIFVLLWDFYSLSIAC